MCTIWLHIMYSGRYDTSTDKLKSVRAITLVHKQKLYSVGTTHTAQIAVVKQSFVGVPDSVKLFVATNIPIHFKILTNLTRSNKGF